METDRPLDSVWRDSPHPAIFRRGKGFKLWVRLDQSKENYDLIKINRSIPRWIDKKVCYEVPADWFDKLVPILLRTHNFLYIIQPYREREECAPKCKSAVGHECDCPCLGRFHGAGYSGNGWFEVSDAYEVRWGEKRWGCRLLKSNEAALVQQKLLLSVLG